MLNMDDIVCMVINSWNEFASIMKGYLSLMRRCICS